MAWGSKTIIKMKGKRKNDAERAPKNTPFARCCLYNSNLHAALNLTCKYKSSNDKHQEKYFSTGYFQKLKYSSPVLVLSMTLVVKIHNPW